MTIANAWSLISCSSAGSADRLNLRDGRLADRDESIRQAIGYRTELGIARRDHHQLESGPCPRPFRLHCRPHGLLGEAGQQGVDFAVIGRVEGCCEIGDVQFDHPVDRAAQQGRPGLVVEGRRAVRETWPVDRHADGSARGHRPRQAIRLRRRRGHAVVAGRWAFFSFHDRLAAISSKAAMVGNSMVASCGSGQLDSFAATILAARLT